MKKVISGLKADLENLKKAQTEAVRNEAKGISEKEREDLASKASSATTQEMTDRVCRESNLVFFWGPRKSGCRGGGENFC